mgnify:CR=1 FL=1
MLKDLLLRNRSYRRFEQEVRISEEELTELAIFFAFACLWLLLAATAATPAPAAIKDANAMVLFLFDIIRISFLTAFIIFVLWSSYYFPDKNPIYKTGGMTIFLSFRLF